MKLAAGTSKMSLEKNPIKNKSEKIFPKDGELNMKEKLAKGKKKRFQCEENCGMCCETKYMMIEITVNDMEVISQHIGVSVHDFFKEHCIVYPDPPLWESAALGGMSRIAIGLKIPCPFLSAAKECEIYDLRPISCRAFPEEFALREIDKELRVADYPCLRGNVRLSGGQKVKVRKLLESFEEELRAGIQKIPLLQVPFLPIDEEIRNWISSYLNRVKLILKQKYPSKQALRQLFNEEVEFIGDYCEREIKPHILMVIEHVYEKA